MTRALKNPLIIEGKYNFAYDLKLIKVNQP